MLSWGSLLGTAVVIYFMYKAVSATKIENGGLISLGEAFKSGWMVYIIGTVISTIFSFILMNYIDPSLLDLMRETQLEAIEKMSSLFNLPEEAREAQVTAIEEANPFGLGTLAMAIPISFLFPGAVIAIIMAAIMKKKDELAV